MSPSQPPCQLSSGRVFQYWSNDCGEWWFLAQSEASRFHVQNDGGLCSTARRVYSILMTLQGAYSHEDGTGPYWHSTQITHLQQSTFVFGGSLDSEFRFGTFILHNLCAHTSLVNTFVTFQWSARLLIIERWTCKWFCKQTTENGDFRIYGLINHCILDLFNI